MSLVKSPKDIVEEAEASGSAGLLSRHDSWGRVEIGNVATIQNGAPFASTSFNTNRSGFPIIRIRDVGKNEISTWFDGEYSDDFIVRHGDLLIGMDGDFRSSRWLGEPALLNQRVCRLIVSDSRIGQAFIEFALPAYLDAIADETSSITVKHLSSKSIQQIPLPLPPLAEQERIVEILEEQFSRLDSALASIKAVREKAKAFRRSLLHSAFSGELTGGTEGWREVRLGEVADVLDSKRKPVNSKERAGRAGSVPYYGATGQVGTIDTHLFDEELVLLGEDGAPFLDLAKPKAYLISGKSWVNNHAHVLRCREGTYTNTLLVHFLNDLNYLPYVNGTTRLKLTQGSMNEIPVTVPPLATQERIVEILEEQFSRLDKALEVANQLEARIASERRSLLHAAFTGELTSQWRKTHV